MYRPIINYILIIANLLVLNVFCNDIIVKLPHGSLRGKQKLNYYAFEGIPYAEPPIGENRFEPPKRFTEKWDGVRDAQQPGPICIQFPRTTIHRTEDLYGEEDCLYLNVYTRNLNPEHKYPVIVHIHGGGYVTGSGDFWGPEYLLQRRVILVTFNYRLGLLGFLSMQDEYLPGNNGLKDQVMALQWIKENIHHFGGDPERITINGFSAGGSSVHLHLLSPLSRGLFHNAISHAGTGLDFWSMDVNPRKYALKLAEFIKCPTDDTPSIKSCLKSKEIFELFRHVPNFRKFLSSPLSLFIPVVEPESPTAFLSKLPEEIIKSGDVAPVPFLSSFCKDEGIIPGVEFLINDRFLSELNNNWLELAPYLLGFHDTIAEENWNLVSNKIKNHFFSNEEINRSTFKSLTKMLTERVFTTDHQKTIKLHAQYVKQPTYFYYYQYPSKYGFEQFILENSDDLGVAHGDDVFLLFNTPFRVGDAQLNSNEIIMQQKLLDLYESFIANEKPNFGGVLFEPTLIDADGKFSFFNIRGPSQYGNEKSKDLANEEFWDNVLSNESCKNCFEKEEL